MFKLRQAVFNFFQKELAPKAQEIDKSNDFKDMRVIFNENYVF
jgi:isovaleryl-CoA dehydrogenase